MGEFISMLVTIGAIYLVYARQSLCAKAPSTKDSILCRLSDSYGGILHMALPLTANRIVLNILLSVESVSIPNKLRMYGYDTTTSITRTI